MHNAFITVGGGKMSKSLGKIMTVQELKAKGYDPMVYRFLVLGSHYRKGIDFSLEGMETVKNAYEKLKRFVSETENGGVVNQDYKAKFEEAIGNDLAMPEAIALVWGLVKDESISPGDRKATLLDFDEVLGLELSLVQAAWEIPEEILALSDQRLKAREAKDWAESDRIRDEAREKGYIFEDSKEGIKIRKI
jgi:cysteinyl-tRNA synthetase